MKNPHSIPTEKIFDRLRFENPWWNSKTISHDILKMKRRLYFDLFIPLVKNTTIKRAVILMGPRRVGKTVMMHHAIAELIDDGVESRKIFFIGIDNPIYVNIGLEELINHSSHASGNENLEGAFIFFDEIQYLNDWERHLKILVDSYPKTKFIVSGSAAAALRLKSSESGAGRFHDFILPPLTFHEFLHLQDKHGLIKASETLFNGKKVPFNTAVDINELNKQFFNYLNYGGYPEVIFNDFIRSNMSSFVKSDIIDKVLLRDLPSLYGIKDVQELNRFFSYIAYNTGKDFSYQKISKDNGLSVVEVKKYIEYLEAAFLIKAVNKIDINSKHFKRITTFKIHLTNPSLRTALFSPINPTDSDAGSVIETSIYSQWLHRDSAILRFSKWKKGRREGEVDMIRIDNKTMKPVWALEIKWSDRYFDKPKELNSIIDFCKSNLLTSPIVTTISKEGTLEYNDLTFHFYPAAVYAYTIGANTLELKKKDIK